jgi:hypothetical protein
LADVILKIVLTERRVLPGPTSRLRRWAALHLASA